VLDFLGNLERTHYCGELRTAHAGKIVVLMGWVNRRRDHGNLIFLDLRDRTGISQIVLDKELTPDGHAKGEQVRPEYVVAAVGKVRLRDKDSINPKMETGEVEIEAAQRNGIKIGRGRLHKSLHSLFGRTGGDECSGARCMEQALRA